MIDYVSCEIKCDFKNLYNIFDFTEPVNTNTGEIITGVNGKQVQTAHLSDSLKLYIERAPQYARVLLKGSLHKHAQGNVNFNDYSFTDFQNTIIELCNRLQIQPENIVLHAFEFGVNTNPAHSIESLLNAIISHKGNEYEKRQYNGSGYLKRFVYSQHEIKIYDKGKQYLTNSPVLRFEIKVKKMQYLQNKGIKISTVRDLLNIEVYNELRQLLLNNIDALYVYDYRINTKAIHRKQHRTVLMQGSNPTFWERYRANHTPEAYKKKVKRFRELVAMYSPSDLQNEFKNMILDKWDTLKNCYPKLPVFKNGIVTDNYPHLVSNNSKLNRKYCLTCGRDITHQKISSVFCSEKLYGREAKKCRNKVSNLKRDEKRKYNGPTLFDIDQYLQPEVMRLKAIANR